MYQWVIIMTQESSISKVTKCCEFINFLKIPFSFLLCTPLYFTTGTDHKKLIQHRVPKISFSCDLTCDDKVE